MSDERPLVDNMPPSCSQHEQQHDPLGEEEEPVATETPAPAYDPERVCTLQQLEVLNIIVHPVWVFDFVDRRMRWANAGGLEVWNAASQEELLKRDFSEMSPAATKRLEDLMMKAALGQHMTEQWTLYPKGKAKTIHQNISGIRLSEDDHMCLLCEGIPTVANDELINDSLRSVEMLRHLPMAVCQFTMEGKVMFQNPEALLWKPADGNINNNNTHRKSLVSQIGQESKEDETPENTSNNNNNNDTQSHDDTASVDESVASRSSNATAALEKAGNLLNRFVEVDVGKRLLQKIQTTDTCDMEAMLHTQKGPKWSAIQMRKTKDPVTGELVILYSARDKSDAIKAQEERQASERKSEFFAIMAHEIRTPLHQVTGFIDLLDQTCLNEEQKSFVKLLKSSAQGLMTVISDVLDYSKLEAGKMKLESIPYEVRSVVEGSMEAVRASCEEKNLYLELEWNKDLPFKIMGDPNRTRQILLNLLSNSVKFTKKGGIRVQAMPFEGTTCTKGQRKPNNKKQNHVSSSSRPMIKFVVSDTGMGVSEEHLEHIFQKYQQADVTVARNFGGTGLGLSICQLLTQNMGGTIGVESELGEGASFWFALPAELPMYSDAIEASEDGEDEDVGSLQVLIVEDNKVNQKLMANMLKRLGHTSAIAENGKIAIDMIEANEYDLVLMDIQMPVMDGLEATRRLRTMGYNTLPIYGLTASVGRSDFVELGFNDWLPKPLPMRDLKTKLHGFKQLCHGSIDHTGAQ